MRDKHKGFFIKAEAKKILDFIEAGTFQFVVPVYQRMYSWDIKHCQQLLEDVLKAGKNRIHAHRFNRLCSRWSVWGK